MDNLDIALGVLLSVILGMFIYSLATDKEFREHLKYSL